MRLDNLSSPINDRTNVFTRLRVEKNRSFEAVETGSVSEMEISFNNLSKADLSTHSSYAASWMESIFRSFCVTNIFFSVEA